MSEQANEAVTTIEERIEIINKIVSEIRKRGRNFFEGINGKQDGHFLLKNGKLYWHEEYHSKPMRLIERNRRMCHHGRTLWYQLLEFRDFIETGVRGSIFSEYWGYPEEDVQAIHQLARELGFLRA